MNGLQKKWRLALVLGVLTVVGLAIWAWRASSNAGGESQYRVVKVERGGLTASVAASGTLNAVVQVQVGSQISGQLQQVLVDFNSEVKKGQLIARIDPETYQYRVRQAEADLQAARAQVLTAQANISAAQANLVRNQANAAAAKRDAERKQSLVAQNFLSPAELDQARSAQIAAEADVKSAEAQLNVTRAQVQNVQASVRQREALLEQAKIDLSRTEIHAPVDGVVIKRSIEPGQTVAASLQAPELFIIAQNLREMQVDTAIDESEIGKIRVGQRASFTVDAFPGRNFGGVVKQVRKAALNVSNVVTYTVVVSAVNEDLKLIPGMTANVRIVTDAREDVLKVPNAALRFRPPGANKGEAQEGRGQGRAERGEGRRKAAEATLGATTGRTSLKELRQRMEQELQLTEAQKNQVDEIFAGMRDRMAALRETPEADRAQALERQRVELRERIAELLSPEQKQRFAAMSFADSGTPIVRGQVYVQGANGKVNPVAIQTGLTDGSMTEVVAGPLKEGDQVIVGTAAAGAKSSPGGASGGRAGGGPRMPF